MTIVDFYDKEQTDDLLGAKADKSTTYTKTEVNNALASKADASTVYTKTEVNTLIANVRNRKPVATLTDLITVGSVSEPGDLLEIGRIVDSTINCTILGGSYVRTPQDNAISFEGNTNFFAVGGITYRITPTIQIEPDDNQIRIRAITALPNTTLDTILNITDTFTSFTDTSVIYLDHQ